MFNNLQRKFVSIDVTQLTETSCLPLRLSYAQLLLWVQRHWFKALLLGFCCFLLFKKDVSLHLSLKNGNGYPQLVTTSNIASKMPTTASVEKVALSNTVGVLNANSNVKEQYVQRFAKVAQAEMKRYGIPASITLAQGLLESNAGKSRLASNNNNHFGIKCFSKHCTKGHCSNFSDDSHKDFFRKYETAWESYRSHSLLLQKDRYQALYALDRHDYKSWAHGLSKAGYATDKKYAHKLIRVIEDMRLYEYDR